MRNLAYHLRNLSSARRAAILVMVVLVTLTWLSACLVLAFSLL